MVELMGQTAQAQTLYLINGVTLEMAVLVAQVALVVKFIV